MLCEGETRSSHCSSFRVVWSGFENVAVRRAETRRLKNPRGKAVKKRTRADAEGNHPRRISFQPRRRVVGVDDERGRWGRALFIRLLLVVRKARRRERAPCPNPTDGVKAMLDDVHETASSELEKLFSRHENPARRKIVKADEGVSKSRPKDAQPTKIPHALSA